MNLKPLDIFNKEKIEIPDCNQSLIKEIKEIAEQLYDKYTSFDAPREMSLAKTNLEQSVMWAVKGIANRCKE